MGEKSQEVKPPEEIRKEIEETRDALGHKVDALAGQLRHGVESARNTGLKVAGVVLAAVVGIITLKRLRRRS